MRWSRQPLMLIRSRKRSPRPRKGKNEGDKGCSDAGHPPGIQYEKFKFQVLKRQFSLVPQSCPTLYNPMDCSMPGSPVHHELPELAQTHVHQFGDAIKTSHPLLSPSPPAFNLSQHQGLFQWVGSSHEVARVLELQLQHQSFQDWSPSGWAGLISL